MKPIKLTVDRLKGMTRAKEAFSRDVEIDKEMAQWLIDRVDENHQRKREETTIRRYVRDFNNRKWKNYTADVGVDGKLRLVQGQHVLVAYIRSNITVPLIVTLKFNPDPDAFRGYDRGRTRSLGQELKWHDFNPKTASTLTFIWQYEQGFYEGTAYTAARSGDQSSPTAAEALEMAKMHPGIEPHMRKMPLAFQDRGIPKDALYAASYILTQQNHERAQEFFTSLFEGTNITPTSPIRTLREALEERKGKERLRPGVCVAWVFKAWNACLTNQRLKKPIMGPKEPFPELIETPLEPPTKAFKQVQ